MSLQAIVVILSNGKVGLLRAVEGDDWEATREEPKHVTDQATNGSANGTHIQTQNEETLLQPYIFPPLDDHSCHSLIGAR